MGITELRQQYHHGICENIIREKVDKKGKKYLNFADCDNKSSVQISYGICGCWSYIIKEGHIAEQAAGDLFEDLTKDFLEKAFGLLRHVRPGNWQYSTTQTAISGFNQYEHLAYLEKAVKNDKSLSSALGRDYIVKPDIIICRFPISDKEINTHTAILEKKSLSAKYTPLRSTNSKSPILHASISCKWTIRSDRSQNTRTEALNLIRNRKGNLPHIVAVTAEPLPTRIAALALGTGDMDCVYHFALPELIKTVKEIDNQDQLEMLMLMIDGHRLRDISDLSFDLAI